jgi:hypothetical protein
MATASVSLTCIESPFFKLSKALTDLSTFQVTTCPFGISSFSERLNLFMDLTVAEISIVSSTTPAGFSPLAERPVTISASASG